MSNDTKPTGKVEELKNQMVQLWLQRNGTNNQKRRKELENMMAETQIVLETKYREEFPAIMAEVWKTVNENS